MLGAGGVGHRGVFLSLSLGWSEEVRIHRLKKRDKSRSLSELSRSGVTRPRGRDAFINVILRADGCALRSLWFIRFRLL